MILLDKPYASPFLIKTIEKNQWPVIATPIAKKMIGNHHVNWIGENKAAEILTNNEDTILYSNSENALAWVEKKIKNSSFNKYANLFKDKAKFREILKEIYPDFQFLKVKLDELDSLDPEILPFPFVIKPSIGFFSVGVYVVRNKEEWKKTKKKLLEADFNHLFPQNVLNTSFFIIEELIEGEEFAVDFYYNSQGKPIILNITKHLFASETDTSDRVYTTSKDIVESHIDEFTRFLDDLGQIIKIRNFPAHAEIRVTKKGEIIPIEINPLRFGGWSTTAEILGIGIGYNTYEAYFNQHIPDWTRIFNGKEDKMYSIIILDNNSGISASEIKYFDYDKLAADLENTLKIRKFDIKKDPVFGFVFAETSKNNKKELIEILQSDLTKYIERG